MFFPSFSHEMFFNPANLVFFSLLLFGNFFRECYETTTADNSLKRLIAIYGGMVFIAATATVPFILCVDII